MSKESAAAFLTKVDEDPILKDKIKELGTGAGFDDLQDIAAVEGYNFTMEELISAGKERDEQISVPESELSEEELAAVAGGARAFTIYISRDSLKVTLY
jgi:predicted ribosomally synthesized peptide with nif11-like leader